LEDEAARLLNVEMWGARDEVSGSTLQKLKINRQLRPILCGTLRRLRV